MSLSYEELVRRNVVGAGQSEWGGLGGDPTGCCSPWSFPQELFIASSQKFVQETELGQRVREWEDNVQPLLQEQVRQVDVRAVPTGALLPAQGTSGPDTPSPSAGAAGAL